MNVARPLRDEGPWTEVYLGLGSNQGDRLGLLRRALFALAAHPEIALTGVSRLYESEYVGPGERQDPYLNACARLRTTLPPGVLLSVLQSVELRLGRQPDSHLRPRPVDLDLLLYGDQVLARPRLQVPHPRLRERAFVLEPLAELAPGAVLPDSQETVHQACERIRRRGGPWIRLWAAGGGLPGPGVVNGDDWFAALALHRR